MARPVRFVLVSKQVMAGRGDGFEVQGWVAAIPATSGSDHCAYWDLMVPAALVTGYR